METTLTHQESQPDVGTALVGEAEMRAQTLHDSVKDAIGRVREGYIGLADGLYTIRADGLYEHLGYGTFKEYVEDRLEFQYRKAMYFVNIREAMHVCRLEWNDVADIDWTKMRMIAGLISKSPEQSQYWLTQAKDMTVKDLAAHIKGTKENPVTEEGPDEKVFKLTLAMNETEHSVIQEALETAKEMYGTESSVGALEALAYDFMQQSDTGPKKMSLEDVLDWVDKTYSVRLAIPEDHMPDFTQENEPA